MRARFGAQADVADIKIRPILLHKGNVRLAIYGLGNIRDERLVQTFKANKVSHISSFCSLLPSELPNQRRFPPRVFPPGVTLHFRGRFSQKGGSFFHSFA
jgi:hypothetical protein